MEQTQFLPGHVSVQTTEKCLECKGRLRGAVNDRNGIGPVRPNTMEACHPRNDLPRTRPNGGVAAGWNRDGEGSCVRFTFPLAVRD